MRLLKWVVVLALLMFVFSCGGAGNLPPKAQQTVRKLNQRIKQIEFKLKGMVLDKQKAKGAAKKRFINKQQKLKKLIQRLKEKRTKIYNKYKK